MNLQAARFVARRGMIRRLSILGTILLACLTVLPAQRDPALLRDLRRYADCPPTRRLELDAALRVAFRIPPACAVRPADLRTRPGGAGPVGAGDVQVSVEVELVPAPRMAVWLRGDLVPAHGMTLGERRHMGRRSWPRTLVAQLVRTSRELAGRISGPKLRLLGFRDVIDREGTAFRYLFGWQQDGLRLRTQLALRPPEPGQELSLEPLFRARRDLSVAAAPFLTPAGEELRAYVHGSDLMFMRWRGLGFQAAARGGRWLFQLAGCQVEARVLRQLADTLVRQRSLGSKVWIRSWSVVGLIPERGFLVLHCPKQAPRALPEEDWDSWLRNNSQATLLGIEATQDGSVRSLRPQQLRLRVHAARFPKSFAIRIPKLGIDLSWSGPRRPPQIRGAEIRLLK